jgi:hypothetical protein
MMKYDWVDARVGSKWNVRMFERDGTRGVRFISHLPGPHLEIPSPSGKQVDELTDVELQELLDGARKGH